MTPDPAVSDPAHTYFRSELPLTVTTTLPEQALTFHQCLPAYAPTPLVSAPHLAAALGVQAAWVKDEANRLGLPAYKILGASWAAYRELERLFGPFTLWTTLDELAAQLQTHLPICL
ncbi:hypothetical protein ACFFLM_02430 [Deinococcus oregonensis]|uniref:Uncharacterized protein n=1 Tax=Deinococcus oregonensis TaxID=1805970 RepID=A0ABV6ATK8_9DEIO